MPQPYARMGYIILRLAAAFAFIYPALNEVSDPNSWLGYVPPSLMAVIHTLGIPELVALHTFGAVEVLIALWIISGWRIFWPSIVATVLLAAIVAANGAQFQILFRDLSIAGMTLALAVVNWPYRRALASSESTV